MCAALLQSVPFSHVAGGERGGRKREGVLVDDPGQVALFEGSQCALQTYSDPCPTYSQGPVSPGMQKGFEKCRGSQRKVSD